MLSDLEEYSRLVGIDVRISLLSYRVLACFRKKKNIVVMSLSGVVSADGANLLVGQEVWCPSEIFPPLPEGQYYCKDLRGSTVCFPSGDFVGTVRAVHDFGADSEILEIQLSCGKCIMLPFNKEWVADVDVGVRQIILATSDLP